MAIEFSMGLERAISIFEDGWASGAMRKDKRPPSHVEPSLRDYWRDGYEAGVADSRGVVSGSGSVRLDSVH